MFFQYPLLCVLLTLTWITWRGNQVSDAATVLSAPAAIDYTQPVFLSGKGWGAFQLLGESSKGTPRVQQDRLLILEDWFGGLLCVLCDGHGREGEIAAQLVIDELPELLLKHEFHAKPHFSLPFICRLLDRLIKAACDGGTTLALTYLRQADVFTATIGDTRISSLRRKAIRRHVREHRLCTISMRERADLHRRGGTVLYKGKRPFIVSKDGTTGLPLYRALGDRRYGNALSHVPETTAISWKTLENATHLILWVDGVWETLDEAAVPSSLIRNWIHAGGRGVHQGAQMLAQNLQMFCPGDNASAIIIDLAIHRPSTS